MNIKDRVISNIKQNFILVFILIIYNIQVVSAQNENAFPVFLPTLSGEYKIGTSHFFLNDTNRSEVFTRKKEDFRRLYIKAWYPSDKCNTDTAKYIPGHNYMALTSHYWWMGASQKYFKKLSDAKTNSCFNVPISGKKDKYPVIIFSHGYGMSLPEFYSSLLENLAVNGYIVLAIGHPYESIQIDYPDGSNTGRGNVKNLVKFILELKPYRKANEKITKEKERIQLIKKIKKESRFIQRSQNEWVKDSKFVIDKLENPGNFDWKMLKNKSDLKNVGALGHSFGGSVTGQFCIEDSRIKAGVNIDGWQYGDVFEEGHTCPFMFIGTEYNDWYDLFFKENKNDFYKIIISNMKHFSYSDMSVFPGLPNRLKNKYLGTLEPLPLIKLSNTLILNFFNCYLKSMPINFNAQSIQNFNKIKELSVNKNTVSIK